MSAFLLDVNVLIALFWPLHRSHAVARRWFTRNAQRGWATCPFTEAGFVRLMANAAVSGGAVSTQDALRVLEDGLRHPRHRFWPAEITFPEAVARFRGRLTGHRQVADAYLLGLAIHHRGKLATLDRSILALLPDGSLERERLEVISE